MDACNQYEVDTYHGWSSRLPRVPSTAQGFELFKEQQAWYEQSEQLGNRLESVEERERKSLDGVNLSRASIGSRASLERSSLTSVGVDNQAVEDQQTTTNTSTTASSARRSSWWRRSAAKKASHSSEDEDEYSPEYTRRSEELNRQLNSLYYF